MDVIDELSNITYENLSKLLNEVKKKIHQVESIKGNGLIAEFTKHVSMQFWIYRRNAILEEIGRRADLIPDEKIIKDLGLSWIKTEQS